MNARVRRRNQLYLAGALPAAVMLFFAVQIGLALKANYDGRSAYDDRSWSDAESSFLDAPGLIQPWVGPFGAGAAAYRGGQYADAVHHFQDALDDVPGDRECDVRRNLALSHEELGDKLLERGKRGPARAEFAAGRSALAEGDCLDDEAGLKLDRRLESKAGGRAPDPDEGASLKPEEKLEELERRNEERRREPPEDVDPTSEPDRQIYW